MTADPDAALRAELVNAMEAHEEGRRGGAYPHLGQMNDIVRFVDWLVDWLEKFAPSALAATASPGLDVHRLAEALHRSGECRMWPDDGMPMTARQAASLADVHTSRHFVTARVIAAQYAALAADREAPEGWTLKEVRE